MLIFVCCVRMVFFLMFKHSFCWKYQYNKYIPVTFNKYMFNFIDLYSFIPGSGCVDIGPKVLVCPRAYHAVKTDLTRTSNTFVILLSLFGFASPKDF